MHLAENSRVSKQKLEKKFTKKIILAFKCAASQRRVNLGQKL